MKFSSGHGYSASYNHFWFGHFSTEFAYANLRNNGHIRDGGDNVLDLGRMTTKVATGIAQWHFSRAGFLDPYIGAGAAYVKAGNLNSADLANTPIGSVTIEKKWGWVANAGVNLNFGHSIGPGDRRQVRPVQTELHERRSVAAVEAEPDESSRQE